MFSKRQQGGGSVMVWGGISYSGIISLVEVVTTMNSREYARNLDLGLLPMVGSIVGENWLLQQDNASVHTSNHTLHWLSEQGITVLEWPAKSPDLNIIENVWGQLAKNVYKNGMHSDNIKDLGDVIESEWNKLEDEYIRKFYDSILRRLISVIEKKEGSISY